MHKKTIVLSISGHDPTGGAGIQADIEVLNSLGCHPCTLITCLTIQDSHTVHRLTPLNADSLIEQATALFNDMPISAIKIGLTGSVACVEAIAHILQQHPRIPVVFDPVLASGDGTALADDSLVSAIREQLLPLTTVLTPNSPEARQLSGASGDVSLESIGLALLQDKAAYVLLTGGHDNESIISNRLFYKNTLKNTFNWPRRAGEFHGTGCTLASAIAGFIAQGMPIIEAIEHAQAYTDLAIKNALLLGKGQLFLARQRP
ncbi:MAG: hydroxymethylpyrimidine/phosphomethylpyrimidine kinase [Cycloclasticus sp.]|nr:hydroxymethylpyrimidine/phosphomethylpyrimidine kinase [Cycloclasticus sp.]